MYTHGVKAVTKLFPAIVYYINTLDNQLCRRSRGVPSILYVEDVFIKLLAITEPNFKNFQSNGLSVETHKYCLVFFYEIWALNKKSRQSLKVFTERPFVWKFLYVGSVIVL